ncbi:MAG: methylenetetrahydrofolate--tRNA-(uracil(54)-C(5))-methyltransferase (FADH(2)-oxidizing) TrmFO [Clostridiales bacterium]|nr:methylenetetrahydrofolate--tRNA-(uracil(54)-C(5))-methyltransferase (FADH(2)-oxidizing) TrmFO [Clostridiales bacterium]
MSDITLTVAGAGLAGCEAAWQAAKRGISVRLIEMKPVKYTPAHRSPLFSELICSNSLRAAAVTNAVGLLKEEMRRLGSLIIEAADVTSVPAGGALAVDRERFSAYITEKIKSHPNISVETAEVTKIPDPPAIIATGPLTSGALADEIAALCGGGLHFFDAVAPIVDASSVDMEKAFFASRWGEGDDQAYLNCPMSREEYEAFHDALVSAETAALHDFDDPSADTDKKGRLKVFDGCMPIEEMAKRGRDTIRFGPLKPVGISHPVTGERYYAVVQLRSENAEKTMYNIVGFQTHLTWPEQRRVFRMIPGLENAEFLRYGVMHRNTFIDSPRLLDATYQLRSRPGLRFAGQMTGVEGYVESAMSGMVCGIESARELRGMEPLIFPRATMTGAMAAYISDGTVTDFQPMNANFALIPLDMSGWDKKRRHDKKARAEMRAEAALEALASVSADALS